MKNKKLISNLLIWTGLLVVFGTHINLLMDGLPASVNAWHVWLNIIAGAEIVWGQIIRGMK